MAANRQKKTVYSSITSDEMDAAFADYARVDAKIQKITAEMDLQITKIREKYQDDLTKLSEQRDAAFDILQQFSLQNEDTLFTKRKSLETAHGVLGFRTGTPKLKTLKKFTWGAVTELLKEFLPGYVRLSEEPAKDKLLADRDLPEVAELLPQVGIMVVQDETFYVEPKKEKV